MSGTSPSPVESGANPSYVSSTPVSLATLLLVGVPFFNVFVGRLRLLWRSGLGPLPYLFSSFPLGLPSIFTDPTMFSVFLLLWGLAMAYIFAARVRGSVSSPAAHGLRLAWAGTLVRGHDAPFVVHSGFEQGLHRVISFI